MTTGLVFTVSARREEGQHPSCSMARTAITWTANENRQLFMNAKCNLTNYVQEASENTARVPYSQHHYEFRNPVFNPLAELPYRVVCEVRDATGSLREKGSLTPTRSDSAKDWAFRKKKEKEKATAG
jgi:uncharacterized sporulation protein YeaH/YhbH (DUF444 family)